MRNLLITILALSLILAAMTGCDREVTETIIVENTDEDCFACHGSDGRIIQAQGEWKNSVHASGLSVDYTNRSSCPQCHNHQGFLDFVETGEVNAPYELASAIHCFTCHSPHERGDLSLRTTDAVEMVSGEIFDVGDQGNLCAHCHHARRSPDEITANYEVTSTHWGPHHGPQGDLLIGSLGYEFDGFSYESSGHAVATPKACATCHMADVRIHNGYAVGGHSFNIEDEEGNDIGEVCEGCHIASGGDINFDADEDFDHDGEIEGVQSEMEGLADSLAVLLVAKGVLSDVEDGHPETGVIAEADLAGALWNYLYFEEDRSEGVHNFRYMLGLLQSSIEVVNAL